MSDKDEYMDEIQETYYVIEAHPYIFYASIKCFDDHDMIHVGAKTRCVTIRYEREENDFTLLATAYDEQCTLDGCMDRGTGTITIKMIKAAFTFVCQQYPHAKSEIVFDDQSTIECSHRKRLNLSRLYLVLHGKTWYEAKFGAYPSHVYSITYENEKQTLRQHLLTKPPYHILMKFATESTKELLEPMYRELPHLRSFVNDIHEQYDCFMFLEWLPALVLAVMPIMGSMTWTINMNVNKTKILVIPLSEHPKDVVFGGSAMNNIGTCRDV
jgi:hypothetical protein